MQYKTMKRLERLTGAWFMREGDVRAFIARAAAMPQTADKAPAADSIYRVVDGMAHIDVCGVLTKDPMPESWMDDYMGTCPTMPILAALERANNDAGVTAVVFHIDSPGGMVAGTNQLAEGIQTSRKPCYAVVSDLAASGGYYIASQCKAVFANAMAEVGAIGVYCVLVDDSQFWKDLGVEFTLVSSGGVKGLGADGKVTPELIEDEKRGVMAMYEKFVVDVATGRGIGLDEARALADGRIWIAPEAKQRGLIDEVAAIAAAMEAITRKVYTMTSEQVRAFAASKAGFADGKADERKRAVAVLESAKGRPSIVEDAIRDGLEPDQVALALKAAAAADAEKAALQAELEKAQKQLALLQQDTKSIGTTPAAPTPATDPDATAKAEWAAMDDNGREAWIDEGTFVKVRAAELRK
jgi:signal peptide peptidase SppA